jgi:ribosomal protein S18 acetylase RimI-like enzyme
MKPLHSSVGIEYGRFELSDLDSLCEVLADSFSRGEPLALATGLSHHDIQAIVKLFGPKAAAEELTVLAKTSSGAVVGALLAQDFATPPPTGLENVTAAFQPIGALLEGLDDVYRRGREIRTGTHLHLFMIGVAPTHSGKKIAQELLATGLNNGVAKGYRQAVTEATGNLSQHIFRKAGFVERHVASYADFVFDEQHVFRTIRSPAGTILMDKQLD